MIVTSWILVYLRDFHSGEHCQQVSEDDGEGSWEDSDLCVSCLLVHRLLGFWRTSDEKIIVNTLRIIGPGGYRL